MNAPTFELEVARLAAAAALRPEHFDEFQRFAKSVVHGPIFQLLFLDCDDAAYRDRLIGALGKVLKVAKLRAVSMRMGSRMIDAAALEQRLRRQATEASVVHLLGAKAWFDAARWSDLNQRRERLARDARVRLVFWLDADAMRAIPQFAEDLWAWRSGVYEFSPEQPFATAERPVNRSELSPVRLGVVDTRTMHERHRRVAELRAFIEAAGELTALKVPLLDELGQLLYSVGQYDEALSHWREVELPFLRALHDERGAAAVWGQIAEVLMEQGQLDEALRIRREEELAVYQRLNDVFSIAVTQGQIAGIWQALGQFDKALNIRLQDELPVYEQFGALREIAMAKGQIADIFERRGQFDEALRIYREEVVPVFERFGDVRAKAATMSRISRLLQKRGQFDEALRIRREEELPVYEKLGDVRARAVTLGGIADVLKERGQLDEALRIYRQEVLPVFKRLGDARNQAVVMGKVANVLSVRGEMDEAIRIRRDVELPVYEKLGDLREQSVCRTSLALDLRHRGHPSDFVEIERLLATALADAQSLRLGEAEQIAAIQSQVFPK